MANNKRVELYRRLPEIYRIKDEDLPKLYFHGDGPVPAFQLRSYLEPVEEMFSAIHENIESLYHDLFIETCDEWVIPYIADLLGTTHLSGDGWTLRADVASTIALRRRKGTLGAIVDSEGYVALVVNHGSAATMLGLAEGAAVVLE